MHGMRDLLVMPVRSRHCQDIGLHASGQVLQMLPQPVEALLPEECVRAAQAILDPSSGLKDAARCATFGTLCPHHQGCACQAILIAVLTAHHADWTARTCYMCMQWLVFGKAVAAGGSMV